MSMFTPTKSISIDDVKKTPSSVIDLSEQVSSKKIDEGDEIEDPDLSASEPENIEPFEEQQKGGNPDPELENVSLI